MSKTAVELLEDGINKVLSHLPIEREEIKKLIEQVKEMEKEQIMNAYKHELDDSLGANILAEQYYKEIFKSE